MDTSSPCPDITSTKETVENESGDKVKMTLYVSAEPLKEVPNPLGNKI